MVQTMTPIKAHIKAKDAEDIAEALAAEKHEHYKQNVGPQFKGYTGGPEEARSTYQRALKERWRAHEPEPEPPAQGQLFSPESIAQPEAHQQTPEQFAADPRTWWHGRVTKGGVRGRLGGSTVGRGEGFHAGTQGAARQRLTTNIKRRGLAEGMAGHLYPLRITGPVEGPEAMREDTSKHIELGPARRRWGSWVGGRTRGYLYEQAVEAPGSISVGVPQRKGFLSTHREMVTQAQKQGQKVHPLIAWAARNSPEHISEEVKQPEPHYKTSPYRQMGLHEALIPSHVIAGGTAQKGEFTAAAKMQEKLGFHGPGTGSIERRKYQTEGGKTMHVWKDTGKDVLGNQWMPQNT